MADNYTLNLKAVLDTTEVKRQLDALRQQQQKSVIGGGSAGGAANGGGVGGLGSLQSTLTRLNVSLQQLNVAIQRFGQVSQMQGIANGNTSTLPFFLPASMRRRSNSSSARNSEIETIRRGNRVLSNVIRDQIRYGGYNHSKFAKSSRPFFNIYNEGISESDRNLRILQGEAALPNQISQARMQFDPYKTNFAKYQMLRGRIGLQMGYGENISTPNFARAPGYTTQSSPGFFAGNNKQAFKSIAGYAFGTFLPQMGEYASVQGNETVGKALKSGGKIMSSAAIGGAFGGPAGAIVMAAFATLGEAMENLTDRAKKLADAMQTQEKRVQSAKDFDKDLKQKYDDKIDERRAKVGDIGYFQAKIEQRKEAIEIMKSQNARVGEGPGALTAYEKETERKIRVFREASPSGSLPDEIKQRQAIADTYRRNLGNIEKYEAQIDGYQQTISGLGYQTEEEKEKKEFSDNVRRSSQYQLKGMFDIWSEDLREAEGRKQALYYKSQEQGGRTVSLTELEDIQKEIDDYTAKLEEVSKELNVRADRRKATEEIQRRDRISELQEQLNNLRAPDMANATSIAAMGFGMGEKDDKERINMQLQYLSEQTRLQKELKNLIADGVESRISF